MFHRDADDQPNRSTPPSRRLIGQLLDNGVCTSVTEISELEGIGKSYVSRILRLALLAPDIIEAILAGRRDQGMMLERLERPLPASWEQQRPRILSTLKP